MASLPDDSAGSGVNLRRIRRGWDVQVRVIRALMIRELHTRFGRENIGFLWMMVEPLLFASLVGVMWTILRGAHEHGSGGITTSAFVATGYIPLTLFRHVVARAIGVFTANSSLMYHRQIKVLDFVLVRFLIEFIGSMMAFCFIGTVLFALGLMPIPREPAYLLAGWGLYCVFVLGLSLILAPLSERSEVYEKLIPVATYIMIPVSGTFTMNEWLAPAARRYMVYSPFVDAMELIRYGVFGDEVRPIYLLWPILAPSLIMIALGLTMCRRVRKRLVVE